MKPVLLVIAGPNGSGKTTEWGRGEIVHRFEGKLEVRFPGHGVKVFKADAPFLCLGS